MDRWGTKKAVATPMVTMKPESEEVAVSGYQDSTIMMNEKSWGKMEHAGKLLQLSNQFGYHVPCVSDTVSTDKEMRKLARKIVVPESELWSDATGVRITELVETRAVRKLMSLRQERPATRQ